MLEKLERFQLLLLGIVLAFGIYSATKFASTTIAKDGISVTGSAYQIVKSDSGKLTFEINTSSKTKVLAYKTLKSQLPIVEKYLQDKGIKDINLKSLNGYNTYKYNPVNGNYTNEVEKYNLTQPVEINCDDVNKIKEISLDITGLIDKGIDININEISYNYSKMSELKVKLLKSTTEDAKDRASAMLSATNNKVGKIQSVKMGVFQITEPNSTNVSDMGINDTSTIDKKVTAVANVVFKIK